MNDFTELMDSRPFYHKTASVSVRPVDASARSADTTIQSGERLRKKDLDNLYFSGKKDFVVI